MSTDKKDDSSSSDPEIQQEGTEGVPVEGETVKLLKRVQTGDRKSLEQLFERYAARVKQIVALHMKQPVSSLAEHDDIVQEALLRAYKRIESFALQSTGTFYSYMVRCVRAAIVDACRKERARKRGDGSVKSFTEFKLVACIFPSGTPTPSAIISGKETEEQIEQALCNLSDKDRHLIMYRCLYGMTFGEISQKLGLGNQQTVRTALVRARRRLAQKIAG